LFKKKLTPIALKKLMFLLVAFILFANVRVSFSQDESKIMSVPEGKAIIYIIRLRDTYEMFRSVNKIDGEELSTLGSRDFVYKIVDPGDHKVVCKGSTKESEIAVKAEAGKKYYVIQRCTVMKMGVYCTKLSMENDIVKAMKIIKDCSEAKFKDAK
jgi:hypothetical protein